MRRTKFRSGTAGPAAIAVAAMTSVQLGAAVSTWMFEETGPLGTAFLRLAWAALMLLLWARPSLRGRSRSDLLVVGALGVMSAAMTICYFLAIDRIPLGVASALEFLGPLVVAIVGLRGRRVDLVWPALAAIGVTALTRPWEGDAELLGLFFGFLAGACLGGYVVFTQKVGDRFPGVEGLAISISVAALCAAPFGLPQASGHLLDWRILSGSAAAALLLPVLPYVLELVALRRLSTGAFGTLMSFEPGIAAMIGLLLLSQSGDAVQYAGIACVMAASLGAVRRGSRSPRQEEAPAPEETAERPAVGAEVP
ncbi:EamA family transporter [Streptomyces populi]|uniref:EamA family transporter n=1 Tax=Streptomyces populi TaxID=2058924 RepID=A0A2I0SHD0_9ACTN|nr:EamA family transporter [Streptomyces populi]PKT69333.1 EamA family transporter [Streptomyces populi]